MIVHRISAKTREKKGGREIDRRIDTSTTGRKLEGPAAVTRQREQGCDKKKRREKKKIAMETRRPVEYKERGGGGGAEVDGQEKEI